MHLDLKLVLVSSYYIPEKVINNWEKDNKWLSKFIEY